MIGINVVLHTTLNVNNVIFNGMKAVIQDIEQKIKTLEAEKKQASSNDDQYEWECVVDEIEQYQKALELVKNNGVLDDVMKCDSLWHNKQVHRFGSCSICNGRKKN